MSGTLKRQIIDQKMQWWIEMLGRTMYKSPRILLLIHPQSHTEEI